MAPDFLRKGLLPAKRRHWDCLFPNPRDSLSSAASFVLDVMNSQNGKCPDIHRNPDFLTVFSFVLSALAVDTHAAYENEISASTPACVSCCPSWLSPGIAAPGGKSQRQRYCDQPDLWWRRQRRFHL